MQPASCIRLQHWQLGCNLWPIVADKDVSVETSRVRLGLRPGILVPDCSVGLPSPATALHMCFLFFLGFFFSRGLFLNLCLVWPLGIIFIYVQENTFQLTLCSSVLLLFVSLYLKGSVHERSRSWSPIRSYNWYITTINKHLKRGYLKNVFV